jgi:hypothetical protein
MKNPLRQLAEQMAELTKYGKTKFSGANSILLHRDK